MSLRLEAAASSLFVFPYKNITFVHKSMLL